MNKETLIFIVDDNATNLKVLADSLKNAGYKVLIAKDGESALLKLEKIQPDLILLDVMMPGIDGFETCKRIKSCDRTKDIPIIFTTALVDIDYKVKGLKLGAVDYITKPFQEEEVLARVSVHIQLRQLNQNLELMVSQRTNQLQEALLNLKKTQRQLIHKEKMSALGEIVAGVAHEINNPLNCITGNISLVKEAFDDLLSIINIYQTQEFSLSEDLEEEIEDLDLDFIQEDLPKMLKSIKISGDRIIKIVNSLRTFSRFDDEKEKPIDIHGAIDANLTILHNRLKAKPDHPEIKIIREYGNIPLIVCFGGLLNQVFMNILTNSIDAIEEKNQGKTYHEIEVNSNHIIVNTSLMNDNLIIKIEDNGYGMSEEVKKRIFEKGFTTKNIGKGTGLGMEIAYNIITEKHNGTIEYESTIGKGTTFIIKLPLQLNTQN